MDEKYDVGVIFQRNSSKTLKTCWLTILCLSFFLFGYHLKECYIKLMFKPEILINEASIYSSDIPFPALTVCPPLIAKSDILNISNFFDKAMNNESISSEELNKMVANAHICFWDHERLMKYVGNKTFNSSTLKILDMMSPKAEDSFTMCNFGKHTGLKNKPKRMLTHLGYCFSYNMLSYDSIFKDHVVKLTSKNEIEPGSSEGLWNLENGYVNKNVIYPTRAQRSTRVFVCMKVKASDITNFCGDRFDTYRAILHLPSEHPTTFHPFFSFELKKYKYLGLTAEIRRKDVSLRKLNLDQRRCYFDGERLLSLFKVYTKNNCEMECLINFTYKSCGCVGDVMPRTHNMKTCEFNRIMCYKKINFEWPDKYYEDLDNIKRYQQFPCDCFPSCTQIKYTINREFSFEIVQDDEYYIHSRLDVGFDDSQIIEVTNYITYNFDNFIADIGGLAGLFLGFSLLSLFELMFKILGIMKKNCKSLQLKLKNFKERRTTPSSEYVIGIPIYPEKFKQKSQVEENQFYNKNMYMKDYKNNKSRRLEQLFLEDLENKYFGEKN